MKSNHEAFHAALADTLGLEDEHFVSNFDLIENNILDSLAIITLIAIINLHFNISVTADDLKTARTVQGIDRLIASKFTQGT